MDEERPLCLLSLDGGGIRGLSELKVLEEIMERIKFELQLDEHPLPADFFDLIGGTSTGGLIALLLGRLRFSVPQAKTAYVRLAKDVFSSKRFVQEGKFDERKLEDAIKELLRIKFGPGSEEERMLDCRDGACKVFVCTVLAKDMGARAGPRLFRTYAVRANRTFNCKIWEASRATSAAPTYFNRISIGAPGEEEEFLDAGIGYNNPVKQILDEANRIFPKTRRIGCIVSIGTGQASVIKFDKPSLMGKMVPLELINALKNLATDSDRVAEEMHKRFLDSGNVYFRFNVDRGLEGISLEEWAKLGEVSTYTTNYLELAAVSANIDKVAEALMASKLAQTSATASNPSSALIKFNVSTTDNLEALARPLALPWLTERPLPSFQIRVGQLAIRVGEVQIPNKRDQEEDMSRYHQCLHDLGLTNPQADMESMVDDDKDTFRPTLCDWIINTREFKEWYSSETNGILWLSGGPGRGKTRLMMRVVHQMLQNISEFGAKNALAFFFCADKDDRRVKATHVIRGLLWQLLKVRPPLFECIKNDYLTSGRATFESRDNADVGLLWKMLEKVLAQLQTLRVYFVIDAIDELDRSTCRQFLSKLTSVDSPPPARWVLSARKETYIEELRRSTTIDLDSKETANHLSVAKYKHLKMEELSNSKRYSNEQLAQIHEKIRTGPDDSFLWVSYLCRELKETEASQALEVLKEVPAGIEDYYKGLIKRMDRLSKANKQLVKDVLMAAVLALQPLTVNELTVLAEKSREGFESCYKLCRSSLKLKDDRLEFFHLSFKQFLEQQKDFLGFDDGVSAQHGFLAQRCFANVCDAFRMRRDSHTSYTVLFWAEHAKRSGGGMESFMKICPEFFKSKSELRNNWFRAYWKENELDEDFPDDLTILHLIAYFGLVTWLDGYPKLGKQIDDRDSHGATPLYRATCQRHDEVVKALLEKGAKRSITTNIGDEALYRAVFNNDEKIVDILLAGKRLFLTGKFDDAMKRFFATPLYNATYHRNFDQMKKLLRQGASGFDRENILSRAVLRSNLDILTRLLNAGADPNAERGEPAIYRATYHDNAEAVKLLLSRGAPATGKESPLYLATWLEKGLAAKFVAALLDQKAAPDRNSGEPPIYRATYWNNLEIVTCLLENNAWPMGRELPLYRAVCNGLADVVKLLLNRRADPNKASEETPIYRATAHGEVQIVECLLRHGAALVNVETPLYRAVCDGSGEIAKLLLDYGANPNAMCEVTPIYEACKKNDTEIARLLLSRDGASTGGSETCLHRAVRSRDFDMVRLLLRKDANPNIKCEESPLDEAVRQSNAELAELLIAKGASTAGGTVTPLYQAVYMDELEIVRIMIKRGADLYVDCNAVPLCTAKRNQDPKMIEILVDGGASAGVPETETSVTRAILNKNQEMLDFLGLGRWDD